MENQNQAAASGPNQQMQAVSKMICPECKKEMVVRMPVPRIFNAIDVSSIVFVHERFDKCAHCQTLFVPIVEGITAEGTILLRYNKLTLATPKSSIVAGTEENMRQAQLVKEFEDVLTKGPKQ